MNHLFKGYETEREAGYRYGSIGVSGGNGPYDRIIRQKETSEPEVPEVYYGRFGWETITAFQQENCCINWE